MKRVSYVLICMLVSISFTFSSSSSWKCAFCRADTDEKVVALTFDDGPHPKYTSEILDLLNEYGIKATFFVIGQNVNECPELILREANEGHEIENHTYSHSYISKIAKVDIRSEIEKCEDAVCEITGNKTRFIRPPGGLYKEPFVELADDMSYGIVLWSVDTKDWASPSVDSIVNCVLSNVKAGDIILMHDYVSARSSTVDALRRIVPRLLAEGYKFVTVSELYEYQKTGE